jgi:hypothetical protein
LSKNVSTPVFFAAVIVFGLSAIAYASGNERSPIVGIWFGRGEPEDKNEVWLDHVNADGTWESQFETCHGKIAQHHVESGTWRMDNGVERDYGQVSDGHPAHFEFDYATVSNNGQTWSYRLAATDPQYPYAIGYLFTATRVNADFRLPGCLQIS